MHDYYCNLCHKPVLKLSKGWGHLDVEDGRQCYFKWELFHDDGILSYGDVMHGFDARGSNPPSVVKKKLSEEKVRDPPSVVKKKLSEEKVRDIVIIKI